MPYLLLIVEPRGQRATRNQAEGQAAYDKMLSWGQSLKERGLLLASESLKSDDAAVRVQNRNGKRMLLDGPFAEAKEMVGGFFMLDCKTAGEAVAIAGECPASEWATVEVREVAPCFA